MDCLVTHPADVPTKDKERRNRNDTVDARKLARSLRNGELTALYVPERKALEDRSLVRMRMSMVKKQTRCKNQIKGLLSFYGYTIPDELAKSHWSRNFINWLGSLEFHGESGKRVLQALLDELKHLRQSIAQLTRHIRTLAQQGPYRTNVQYLKSIPGISTFTSMVLFVLPRNTFYAAVSPMS